MSILEEKRDMVRQLEAKLAALNEKLEEALRKKKKLQEEVNHCSEKLHKAEKLISKFTRVFSSSNNFKQ